MDEIAKALHEARQDTRDHGGRGVRVGQQYPGHRALSGSLPDLLEAANAGA